MKRPVLKWPDDLAKRYVDEGFWTGEGIDEALQRHAHSTPDRLAVVDSTQRLSYAQLNSRVDRLASGLVKLGFVSGDRVLVQLPNRVEFLLVTFALLRSGIVPVFALPAHRYSEVEYFARKAGVRGYITVDRSEGFDFRELARHLKNTVPEVSHFVVCGDAEEFTSLDSIDSDPVEHARPSADELVLVQLSGGSGGRSKLIPRASNDYLYSVRASVPIAGMTAESVFMPMVPVAHNFPMSSPGFLGAVYAGSATILIESRDPKDAFDWIEKEKVTHVCMVPPLALLWLDAVKDSTANLSSLEVIQIGGQKLMPETARRIMPAFGCKLQQVFGMAEGLVNYTRLNDSEDVICETQGRPISSLDEIRIVDASDNLVPDGTHGRLLTRGPYTIRGYLDDPSANDAAFTEEGFYRTGDVVIRRPDGYLVVEGRVTDQINRGGEKISADEIESHLLAHPAVFDAVVVGIGDQFLGERSCAFLICHGERPRIPEIKTWLRERGLATYKIPDRIRFLDEFPHTGVGKVARRVLRDLLRVSE